MSIYSDWQIQTSFTQATVNLNAHGRTQVKTVWRAFAKQGAGLVAMGSIYDEFVMMEEPSNSSYAPSPVLQIESRMFQVRDVFVEELFSPAPWPLDMLPSQRYALRRTFLLP